jgi:pyruvate formate lyase activating enzyme
VINLAEIASKYLEYVYVGNTGIAENSTKCPSCSNLIVKRTGYKAEITGIKNGICSNCSKKINLIL